DTSMPSDVNSRTVNRRVDFPFALMKREAAMTDTPLRDTPYATELAHATITFPSGSEGRVERLRFKEPPAEGMMGYRFWWWKEGRMLPRPLDATEDELLALLKNAFQGGVFSERFLAELQEILQQQRESGQGVPERNG